MGTLESLDASQLAAAMVGFRDALRSHQAHINSLNVFPVPDGDTGTNMALTLEAVVGELEALGGANPAMAGVCQAMAHGSLMGARGNSGVVLSQILRAVSEVAAEGPRLGPAAVTLGLERAAETAYGAFGRPVEGTILTVARRAAEVARQRLDNGGELVEVLDAARLGGGEALEHTPDLLPVLAEAGVVDAGGAGYLLLLDSLLMVAAGRPLPEPAAATRGSGTGFGHAGGGQDLTLGPGGLRYEVMYLLEAPDDSIPAFREAWAGVGDSIVVVGGGGVWNCHIHTDDVGVAIEVALDVGRPRRIQVTDLAEQVEEERWVREGSPGSGDSLPPGPSASTAVVAVATGEGVRRIFRSLGVQQIVAGGQSMNPSTAQILQAVEEAPASEVVILPNNDNILAVAEQVDALTDKRVALVGTSGVAEGFSALLAYDPGAGLEENVAAMQGAARRVVSGEVTRAVRASSCAAGPIAAGDWIGLAKGGIEVVGSSLPAATCELLERLIAGHHEVVTLIEGEGARLADTRRITEWLASKHPGLGVEVHHGGQPLYAYLVSIE